MFIGCVSSTPFNEIGQISMFFAANKALLQIVYENSEADKRPLPSDAGVFDTPAMWCYRRSVSLDHLVYALTEAEHTGHVSSGESSSKYPLLNRFLRLEPILRHMRHLPMLVNMITTLQARYARNISRSDAAKTTMRDLSE